MNSSDRGIFCNEYSNNSLTDPEHHRLVPYSVAVHHVFVFVAFRMTIFHPTSASLTTQMSALII